MDLTDRGGTPKAARANWYSVVLSWDGSTVILIIITVYTLSVFFQLLAVIIVVLDGLSASKKYRP